MKNRNLEKALEQALEHLMDSHIIGYDKEIFYFLELKNYTDPGLEMLLDTTVKNHINIVGKTTGFQIRGNKKDLKKALYANIITNNINKRIIESENMIGKWVFETYSKPTKNDDLDVTGKFTYIAELPVNSNCESIEAFVQTAIESFLTGRNRLALFSDTPVDEITYDLLCFEDTEFSDVEVFIDPEFERFLQHNFGKDNK